MKPPELDRLAIKRQVLEKFPLLDYDQVEVLTPHHATDSFLLEHLDNGSLEGGLTDQLFFDLLAESPDYLAFEPFRKKVKDWQETMRRSSFSKDERDQAKKNLKRIGAVLAMELRGRPAHIPGFQLKIKCGEIEALLAPFLSEIKDLTPKRKAAAFKERFPGWAEYSDLLKRHHSPLELAKTITCKEYNFSRRQLQTFLKK